MGVMFIFLIAGLFVLPFTTLIGSAGYAILGLYGAILGAIFGFAIDVGD